MDEYFTIFNLARKQELKTPETCNQVFVKFFLEALIKTIERLHSKVCHMVTAAIYLSILGDLLRKKRINTRQHAILEHVLQQGQPVSEADLKSQSWYTALYKRLSPATKSRDWKQLREENLIEVLPDGRIRPGSALSVPR